MTLGQDKVRAAYERSIRLAAGSEGAALVLARLIEAGREDLLDQLEQGGIIGERLWLLYHYVTRERLWVLTGILDAPPKDMDLPGILDMIQEAREMAGRMKGRGR